MAFIDDVLDTLATNVTAALAPYQPNLPPTYPNTGPFAGTIPPTLSFSGRPIQNKVMKRLENKMCSVGVYDQAPERLRPFLDTNIPTLTDGHGNVEYEVGRTQKRVIIEVWAYDRPGRRAIQDIIRRYHTDVINQAEADGTTTKLFYVDTVPFDMEQKDSVYIGQIHYMADFVVLGLAPGAPATTIDVDVKLEDINGLVLNEINFVTT